jgi:hypothetical protein
MLNEVEDRFSNNVYDVDEFKENIRLKPDYYIHLSLQQLSRVFEGDVVESEGISKYIHIVAHIEIIARSAGLLSKTYDVDIKKIREGASKEEYSKQELNFYVARERLNIIIGEVFSSAPARGALRLYENLDGSTSRQNETYKKMKNKLEEENS